MTEATARCKHNDGFDAAEWNYVTILGYSYYVNAKSISPHFYQKLVDRCWRRSGSLLYRPHQRVSCCPHYTIRLDASKFSPSRAQRQAVNKFNKHILGSDYIQQAAKLHPKSRKEAKKRDNVFVLPERIHEAERRNTVTLLESAHSLEIILEKDNFTEEKWLVFDQYQAKIHHDPPEKRDRESFTRFLCNSPLRRDDGDNGNRKLGSFHQCYRIDGILVAVGVVDLLPHGVSSVYFFYHERIHEFSPGKLSALREIVLASEQGYQHWYPGYYIHSCPKMRYKLDYTPQEMIDPVSLHWEPLSAQTMELFDQKSFVSPFQEREDNKKKKGNSGDDAANADTASHVDDDAVDSSDADEDIEDDIFTTKMPGVATLAEVEAVDIDHIPIRHTADGPPSFMTENLQNWTSNSIRQPYTIKYSVAELVAAIGVDMVDEICLDISRG